MAEVNSGRNTQRALLHSIVPLQAPFSMQLALGSICNFHCHYCAQSVPGILKDKKFLSWELFVEIMEQAGELCRQYKIIRLVGIGEPLLNPRAVDMVRYITRIGLSERVEITTNGSVLSRELAVKLRDAGLTRLIVSLQGLNAGAYKKTSGVTVDFEDFLNRLRFFYENRGDCRLHLKIVDTALEEGAEPDFFRMFEGMCDTINIDRTLPVFKPVTLDRDVQARTKINMQGIPLEETDCCSLPFYDLNLNESGDVFPCCALHAPKMGNIYEMRLAEIWNGAAHENILKTHLRGKRESIAACRNCSLMYSGAMPQDRLDGHAEEILQRMAVLENVRNAL